MHKFDVSKYVAMFRKWTWSEIKLNQQNKQKILGDIIAAMERALYNFKAFAVFFTHKINAYLATFMTDAGI